MHTITRNTNSNAADKRLLIICEGKVYVPLKSAKILCGYSQKSSNSTILDKVSQKNVIVLSRFSKKGSKINSFYLTTKGFCELVDSITQADKKQNGLLALDMINSVQLDEELDNIYKICENKDEDTEIDSKLIAADFINVDSSSLEASHETELELTDDEIIDEIISLVGQYDKNSDESKAKWKKLYDGLDKSLDESIRKSWQRYKRDNNVTITILNYIKTHTKLLPKLLNVARELF